ncbi:glycoside hydrolase family 2 protein [Olivibacter domesticus]|uniref:Beta-galactosidase/beta-glucuronidase n=1 Tax=Olivibacter domesticus TaxID=407022 RepID=A0A1H7VUG6_OLID1|nr:sugar-binding domain-containing protein [Olivibacter domesticus]SEM12694.1 Beta-galactosidase/beta-glucuronidase [Olivibacter domesticus]
MSYLNPFTKTIYFLLFYLFLFCNINAQSRYELNSGWKCINYKEVKQQGEKISLPSFQLKNWKNAVVPGTVLTTMLQNKEIPDPFYGMNNEKIPDIYTIGKDYYTYWFVKDFEEKQPTSDQQVWLHFRGINYSCEVYLNGHKVNTEPFKGMYLRKAFNITSYLREDGKNRLAVIVFPPDEVGNPNGGQGGDGTIAKNVGLQYTAGWDWIKPIRDRNTGIWDKVSIEKTGSISIQDPHIITLVPGKRKPSGSQMPAIIKTSASLTNSSNEAISGTLEYTLENQKISKQVTIAASSTIEVALPEYELKHPKLWWPANYGAQHLYTINLQFIPSDKKQIADSDSISFGVREIQTTWNAITRSREIAVNGQEIFIKGGNWIISDAMLRFSKERYDAEIRFHRDMNLNLIRIWGGALVERPEFYEACDRYGLLVFQDFWMSGDCNGRWEDPKKLDDQWTRRQYPDDHHLFLESAADMIKMIRNHASLAMWCGGNEITPPDDILTSLRDSILPKLDGTRWFVDYSNSDAMSYNFLGGNGDGPYGIQPTDSFWASRTWPFNSEVGSVGVGDIESLKRFLPIENQTPPQYLGVSENGSTKEKVDSVWDYHTYISYGAHINAYGAPKNLEDFAEKAQLVNYDQYRALMEGFSAHMWDWYTGTIIWKTQNPWTSMRGQMYDYYLDPNAALYGLRSGSEPLHAMYNPVDGFIMMVNNHFESRNNMMLVVKAYDMQGKEYPLTQVFTYMEPSSVKRIISLKERISELSEKEGLFLSIKLLGSDKNVLSDNFYWLPSKNGNYDGLNHLKRATLQVKTEKISDGTVQVTLTNDSTNTVAFFNRLSIVNAKDKQRILPTFYDNNYVSVLPGEKRTINISTAEKNIKGSIELALEGWNVDKVYIPIKK